MESEGPSEVTLEDWNEAESSDDEQEVPGYSAEAIHGFLATPAH